MILDLPPALILLAGALLIPWLPRSGQAIFFPVFPLAALGIIILAPDGTHASTILYGQEIVLFKIDALSRVFGIVFALIGAVGGVFAMTLRDAGQRVAGLLYMAGALGVTFAGDLLTLVTFWELMAVASTYLIWARRTTESQNAGWRYLLFHLFGGSILLGGVTWQFASGAGLDIRPFDTTAGMGAWLILAGVCVNAAVPPLHAWLADAYPRATVTGAVFLSAFTTKSAVYVLARVFPGWEVLLYAGLVMVCLGSLYGLLANDIRQILAYSTISQVGYMVVGVGLGSELALNGTVANAFSHILYKALLFMAAGAIIESTGRSRLTELSGLSRSMPLTCILYFVGAAAISGLPPFNGFISKPLLISAALEQHRTGVEWILTLGAIATFLHTGLRLPLKAFFGPGAMTATRPPPVSMHAAMIFLAALCLGFGLFPSALYYMLPSPAAYHPYTLGHLTEVAQLCLFAFLAFYFLRGFLMPKPVILLDSDWFYRRPAEAARRLFVDGVAACFERCQEKTDHLAALLAQLVINPGQALKGRRPPEGPFDPNAARRPVGLGVSLTLLIVVLVTVWAFLRTKP